MNPTKTVPYFLAVVFLLPLISSCTLQENDKQAPCLLESIHYDERNRLRFLTISGGRVYQLSQEYVDFEGEVDIIKSYSFQYYQDSLAIKDSDYPYSLYPFITVSFEDEIIKRIVRYSSTNGVRLFHEFNYAESGQIRVDLSRVTSAGNYLYLGYALYYLDSNNNVRRSERFRIDLQNIEDETLYKIEDRTYTYDEYPNPFKSLIIPFFTVVDFADPRFFSANNMLSEEDGEAVASYLYEYGEKGNVQIQYRPGGEQTRFIYLNCE